MGAAAMPTTPWITVSSARTRKKASKAKCSPGRKSQRSPEKAAIPSAISSTEQASMILHHAETFTPRVEAPPFHPTASVPSHDEARKSSGQRPKKWRVHLDLQPVAKNVPLVASRQNYQGKMKVLGQCCTFSSFEIQFGKALNTLR